MKKCKIGILLLLSVSMLLSFFGCTKAPKQTAVTLTPEELRRYQELFVTYPILNNVTWERSSFRVDGSYEELLEVVRIGKENRDLFQKMEAVDQRGGPNGSFLEFIFVPAGLPGELEPVWAEAINDKVFSLERGKEIRYLYQGEMTFWSEEAAKEITGDFNVWFYYSFSLKKSNRPMLLEEYVYRHGGELNEDGVYVQYVTDSNGRYWSTIDFSLPTETGIGEIYIENCSGSDYVSYELLLSLREVMMLSVVDGTPYVPKKY